VAPKPYDDLTEVGSSGTLVSARTRGEDVKSSRWVSDDDIDLRWWLAAVNRHWHLVVAGVVVAAAGALVFTALAPRRYEAAASVLLTGPRYRVTLNDPKFTTVDRAPAAQAASSAGRADEVRTVVLSREVVDAAGKSIGADPVGPRSV